MTPGAGEAPDDAQEQRRDCILPRTKLYYNMPPMEKAQRRPSAVYSLRLRPNTIAALRAIAVKEGTTANKLAEVMLREGLSPRLAEALDQREGRQGT